MCVAAEAQRRGERDSGFVQSIHDTLHAVNKNRMVEVDEQSKLAPCEPQVAQQLGAMHLLHNLDGLDLDDDALVYPEVEPEPQIELLSFVADRHGMLLKERNSGLSELTR
jgi:hypothetical protein